MTSNSEPGMTRAQADEILRLQRRADRRSGCLFGIIMSLLFSWLYWIWLVLKWTAIGSWKLLRWAWSVGVAICRLLWRTSTVTWRLLWRGSTVAWHWTIAGARMLWPHAQSAIRAFHTRYGIRGWAVAGTVVIALLAIGLLVSR